MPLLSQLRAKISRPKVTKDKCPAVAPSVKRDGEPKPMKKTPGSIVKSYLRNGGKTKVSSDGSKSTKKSQKLSRSDTFTVNDPQLAENYPSSINGHHANFNTFTRNRGKLKDFFNN